MKFGEIPQFRGIPPVYRALTKGGVKWARELQASKQASKQAVKSLTDRTLLLTMMVVFTAARVSLAQEDFVPPDDPGDCEVSESVEGCVMEDIDGKSSCGSYTLCPAGHEKEKDAAGEDPVYLDWTACSTLLGTAGDDIIYIGSAWHKSAPYWWTEGDLGVCINGTMYWCDLASLTMTVKLFQGSDIMRVPTGSSIYECGSSNAGIGAWSFLDSGWQDRKLKVYACAGTDSVYTTPNDDTVIGGSGGDTIYGREGADSICGGYGTTFGGHACSFCDSGANCTTSGGYDTGNDIGDIMHGNEGNDTMCGVDGADYMYGEDDDDTMFGLNGCDYMVGDTGSSQWGNDVMYAARGTSGSDLTDLCSGGHNSLIGGNGDDTQYGSNSADYIWGEINTPYSAFVYDGEDEQYGYGGNDKLCPGGAWLSLEEVYGGNGDDLIVYYASDYGWFDCVAGSFGACADPEKTADGGLNNDRIFYRPMNCNYNGSPDHTCPLNDFPPPATCFGGTNLFGGDGTDDCCFCNTDLEGVCTCDGTCDGHCECEDNWFNDPGDFPCPFPYLLTDPGWSCV